MTPSLPDPIQAQLVAARRNQILDAAAKVFAEKGFHPTTIKDIASEAGVAHGTVYTYFESKTALLIGIFERMRASIVQEHVPSELDMSDVRTVIKALQLPLMTLRNDNFALFRIIVSEMMVNEELRKQYYQQIMEPTLKLGEEFFQAHAAKRGLSPVQAQLTVRAISGMILGLMLEYAMGDQVLETNWEELQNFLSDFLARELGEV